jgi:hypothetical protein
MPTRSRAAVARACWTRRASALGGAVRVRCMPRMFRVCRAPSVLAAHLPCLPRTLRHHVAHLPWTLRTVRDVRRPRKLRDDIADLSTGRRRCAASWSLSVKRCRVGLGPHSTDKRPGRRANGRPGPGKAGRAGATDDRPAVRRPGRRRRGARTGVGAVRTRPPSAPGSCSGTATDAGRPRDLVHLLCCRGDQLVAPAYSLRWRDVQQAEPRSHPAVESDARVRSCHWQQWRWCVCLAAYADRSAGLDATWRRGLSSWFRESTRGRRRLIQDVERDA